MLFLLCCALAQSGLARAWDRDTRWQVAEIYLATMGHAPDAEGLAYWVNNIQSLPEWTPTTVAQSFFDQPLVQAQYPEAMGDGPLIEALYQNLFGRAADAEGYAYWLGERQAGRILRNQMIIALINGGWTNPDAVADMARFGNRVSVALAFADYQVAHEIVYSALSAEDQASLREAGREVLLGVGADDGDAATAIARIPQLLAFLAVVQTWSTNLTLVEASAVDTRTLVVSWLPVDDGITPGDQITYEVHLSQTKDFVPSGATLAHQQAGVQSAEIGGLVPGALYYVKMLAYDPQGHQTGSDQTRILMPEVEPIPNAAQTVTNLASGDVLGSTDTTLTLRAGMTPPDIGTILADGQNALIRRVTAVATNPDGTLRVSTAPASIAEMFDRLQISGSIQLAPIPESSSAAKRAFNRPGSPAYRAHASGAASVHWPESGLTLIGQPAPLVSTGPPALQAGLQRQAASDQSLYSEAASKTEKGSYVTVSGAQAVAIVPGNSGTMTLALKLHDDEDWFGNRLTICDVTDLAISSPSGKPSSGLVTLGSISRGDAETVPSYSGDMTWRYKSATMPLNITATEDHVSDQPYRVRVRAYVDEAGNVCQDTWYRNYGNSLGWEEVVPFEFDLYVTSSPNFPDNEEKTLTFSGGFSVTNNVQFSFAPTVEADVRVDGARLQSARLEARADARFTQELRIVAQGAATLDQTKTLFEREFIKVYMAGSVPVVMKGRLAANLRIEGRTTGVISATETLNMEFDELAFGFKYENGQYEQIRHIQPVYQLSLHGDADAEANLKISLLPELRVTFYEVATGAMVVQPYLEATAGIHGQIHQDYDPDGGTLDADYWLTKGLLTGGVNLWLYADLSVWDHILARWPKNAKADDYETFFPLSIIDETRILGLPTLSAEQIAGTHPSNSRALLIEGRHENVANPFQGLFGVGPDAFITFSQWTQPKVIAVNDVGYEILNQVGVNNDRFWIDFDRPGTYQVRLGGYSSLGGWARQVVQPEITLNLADANYNGMLDHWEERFGVSDPNGNPDGDELTNLEEFNAGHDPTRPDDGTVTYLWVVGPYSACEADCGATATQNRDVWCETEYGGNLVLDLYCDDAARPPSTQACTGSCGGLNDTGITACADASSGDLGCPVSGYPGQDAEYGRDVTHDDDSDGHAGFSFTKLDGNGNALPASATSWSCVRDNVTGLTWEIKTDDGGLRDQGWTYTWYNPDAAINGGSAGTANGGTCSGSQCDTQAYVQAVNAQGLCGAGDWRLPDRFELESITSNDRLYPAIDSRFFPNTPSHSWFWSSSPYASYSYVAWYVHFNDGSVGSHNKYGAGYVRLVRGGQ
jgi:hypothetical protein